jgi:hypothetical protein
MEKHHFSFFYYMTTALRLIHTLTFNAWTKQLNVSSNLLAFHAPHAKAICTGDSILIHTAATIEIHTISIVRIIC